MRKARDAEQTVAPGKHALTEAVARAAFALMAIKDEYEVARLLTLPEFRRQIDENFTGDVKISYHLAPLWLASRNDLTGRPEKMTFGGWLTPVLKGLARLKFLRETAFDPFNLDRLRQRERKLRDAYISDVDELTAQLTPHNYELAVGIAALPLTVRGYGHIKERALAQFTQQYNALWAKFTAAPAAVPVPALG